MGTIKDVAKLAGVSTATVSRVLNDNYPVHPSTRTKVLDAVKQLDYRINAVARGLKTKSTFMVGMLAPDMGNAHFVAAAKAIEAVLSPKGYHLVLAPTHESAQCETDAIEALYEKQVDGMIIASRQRDSKRLNVLMAKGVKITLMDTLVPGFLGPTFVENDQAITEMALTMGIEKGHRAIAILKGNMQVTTAQQRYAGYVSALKAHGIKAEKTFELSGGYELERAYDAVKALMIRKGKQRPSLLFSSNNKMTEGAMMACKDLGLEIPEDLSLISFGNIELAGLIEPKLTHIRQEPEMMGQLAALSLLAQLEGKDELANGQKTHVIPLTVITGDSVRDLQV